MTPEAHLPEHRRVPPVVPLTPTNTQKPASLDCTQSMDWLESVCKSRKDICCSQAERVAAVALWQEETAPAFCVAPARPCGCLERVLEDLIDVDSSNKSDLAVVFYLLSHCKMRGLFLIPLKSALGD